MYWKKNSISVSSLWPKYCYLFSSISSSSVLKTMWRSLLSKPFWNCFLLYISIIWLSLSYFTSSITGSAIIFCLFFLLFYVLFLWPCSSSYIRQVHWSLVPHWMEEQKVVATWQQYEAQGPKLSSLLPDKGHWDLHYCTKVIPVVPDYACGGPNLAFTLVNHQPPLFLEGLDKLLHLQTPYYMILAIVVKNL